MGKHRGRPDVGTTSLAWILPRKLTSIDDSNPITGKEEKKTQPFPKVASFVAGPRYDTIDDTLFEQHAKE